MTPHRSYQRGGMLRLLSPFLGGAEGPEVQAFLGGLMSKVPSQHLDFIERDSDLGVPERDDVVVVPVPDAPGRAWRNPVRGYLTEAVHVGAEVIPVALRNDQSPPSPLEDVSPIVVQEIIDSYRLGAEQLCEAGSVFSRVAVSRLWPTYSQERLQLFLSHRRVDGASIASRLSSAISELSHRSWRDVADIRPGSLIPANIARDLRDSDVFVLCDTPEASGDHAWLKDELCFALGLGLPIVWVRFGQVGSRSGLQIRPADSPDLDLHWPEDGDYHAIAARILDMAFVAGRNQVRRVESCIARARNGMDVQVLDARRRILSLERPRLLGPFELKDRIVVQAFARRPTLKDAENFAAWLRSEREMSEDGHLKAYDVAVMMAPSPVSNDQDEGVASKGWALHGVGTSHGGSLVTALTRTAEDRRGPADHRELLLFAGMGPGAGAGHEFRDAVQDLASYWLGRGGRIRFGGHPTVTPTVNWVARSEVPGREREHVMIYQSEFFATPQLLAEISAIAEVVGTPVRGEGVDARQESLTYMRERMVADSSAVASVVIGGLTRAESNRQPGVEEEMLLARQLGIPVFILGATGGQASVLVEQARNQDPPFDQLGNGLSIEQNEFLATTDDYTRAADMIWTATDQ